MSYENLSNEDLVKKLAETAEEHGYKSHLYLGDTCRLSKKVLWYGRDDVREMSLELLRRLGE